MPYTFSGLVVVILRGSTASCNFGREVGSKEVRAQRTMARGVFQIHGIDNPEM